MSLYLKYRPKDFSSLVGQNFIRDTLKNAIKQEKLVGAYLFTGPRGTGKTSTARIFANAINCLNSKDGNPCGVCEICSQFSQGKLLDIIEIDAASHTGVDNVREIIEKAQFSPNLSKYKVYIIDEVHMLSKGAFNALLKILEEPPSHVKFILATTEVHKVLDTIQSRCQRYDFRSIDDISLRDRLIFISKEEGISIDHESLTYIVTHSGGGLRNAINLFEQLAQNGSITYAHLIDNLGVTSYDLLQNFYAKLLEANPSIIADFDQIYKQGKNLKLFFKDLIYHIKDILISELQSGIVSQKGIHILDVLDETYGKTKYALDDSITFLTGILKILSGESNIQKINTPSSSISSPQKAKENPQASAIEQKENKKQESISEDEVLGIFQEEVAPLQTLNEALASNDFNKNYYIEFLQKAKAAASIITSLRESEIHIQENMCSIKAKNKMAKISLEKNENIPVLQKGLQDMGYHDVKINFL